MVLWQAGNCSAVGSSILVNSMMGIHLLKDYFFQYIIHYERHQYHVIHGVIFYRHSISASRQ